MRVDFGLVLLFLSCLVLAHGQGDEKKKGSKLDIDALRSELKGRTEAPIKREKSAKQISETLLEKENILASKNVNAESDKNVKEIIKKLSNSTTLGNFDLGLVFDPKLGIQAQEAIQSPDINVIDNHVEEIINTDEASWRFSPDIDEIRKISRERMKDSDIHNLYRENLRIQSIEEEVEFKIGHGVEYWKTASIGDRTAIFGLTTNNVVVAIGSNGSYNEITKVRIDTPQPKMSIETMKIWDYSTNKQRIILLLGVSKDLIWYELVDGKSLVEIRRVRLLNNVDKVSYFQHDGSDLIMITTIDDQQRVEVNFHEFDLSTEDFWLVQNFKLPIRPVSMVCIDAGRDFIIAFTQDSHVSIYRHQHTKFNRGKFSFMKKIDAGKDVNLISGFRIGGHTYLAIGGDQPQIYRYVNGDFQSQAILSQTFGYVEEFLPIPIQIYRDDLVLLVQHRIDFGSHTLVAVDALIWNGIAFENVLSVPCTISAYPNANGFTCALDPRRDEGLRGSTFIVEGKTNNFHLLVPRDMPAHSGLFRIKYEIVEAEDPLITQMEQIHKSIELINGMLDFEAAVKLATEEYFAKSPFNPENNFEFENLHLDMIETDVLQHIEKVTLESNQIEFLNNVTFDKEDMLALELLDSMEATLEQDEERLRQLDAELNRLIRVNRQTAAKEERTSSPATDSPIINLGPFSFNGQLNTQNARVNPFTRQRRQIIKGFDEVKVKKLNAESLTVDTINGIPIDKYVFLQNDGELLLPDSEIIFEESVQVKGDVNLVNDGKVNKIDLSNEILAVESPSGLPDNLHLENLLVESLIVNSMNNVSVNSSALNDLNLSFEDNLPIIKTKRAFMRDNLNVETVNGMKWDDFVSRLIFKREPSHVDSLTVNGNLWIIGDRSALNAKKINQHNFPQDFVLKKGQSSTVIGGKKTFKGLATNEIDTDGKINGINPFEVITLDQPQLISTETTFNVMEVVKKLEVSGTISGQKLDEFLPNPTLELTKEILASCTFKDLTVEGDLKIENNFNGFNLEKVLADAVYDDVESIITAPKVFANLEVKGNANISSNFINDINLRDIMTTNGEQEVSIERLQGEVKIDNLKLGGLFDGINPTLLEADSVRTFGDQFIETPLIIAKGGRVGASSLDVKISLNDVPIESYTFVDQAFDFPPNARVEFLNLSVGTLNVANDVVGTGGLTSLNLPEFLATRISKSLKQAINVPVEIGTLTTKNVFTGGSINGLNFDKFKSYMVKMKNFSKNLLSGDKIDTLVVDGNALIKFINGQDLNALASAVIWLDKTNEFNEVIFLDDIEMKNLKVEGSLNGKNFAKFIENWVSKNENKIKINADVTIEKDLIVSENLVVPEINNVKFEDFLRKDDIIEVPWLNIVGQITTDKLIVKNSFNGKPLKEFNDLYSYDKDSYYHIVHANVNFHQPSRVAYLNTPFFNGKNVAEWLESLVKINDDQIFITGPKIFKEDVMAQNGIFVENLNDLNIEEKIKNIVTIDNATFYGDIVFEDDVYADIVALRSNLTTDNVNGFFLKEWTYYPLLKHKNVAFNGDIRMKSSDFYAKHLTVGSINGIPFDKIITLKTDQSIDELKIDGIVTVRQPLKVKRFFTHGANNDKIFHDLKAERENSILINDKNSTVDTPVTFYQLTTFLGPITCQGHVNSKRIENIVLLDSSPKFDSKLNFKSLEAQSISSDYLISGVDFNKWLKTRVWKRSSEPQVITGDWSVKQAKMHADCSGNGLINGRSINQIEKNLKENVNQVQAFLSNYTGQYRELCKKLQSQVEDFGHNSVHILKYLELDFKIIEDRDIYSFYDFATKRDNFLIVNSGCNSKLHLWMKSKQKYLEADFIETGVILEYAIIEYDNGDFYVITSSKSSESPCKYNGLNSWKLVDRKLIHITQIITQGNVQKIFSDHPHSRLFYALDSTDRVTSFDAFGVKVQEWKLPSENLAYSFLPHGILPNLNLYDGRRILSLESSRRVKRTWYDDKIESRVPKAESKLKPFVVNKPDFSIPVFNKPDFSIPIIKPMTMQTAKEDNFLAKTRNIGEIIRASINGGKRNRTTERKFDPNWAKTMFKAKVKNDTEPSGPTTREGDDKPSKLLFNFQKPNFDDLKNVFGLQEKILNNTKERNEPKTSTTASTSSTEAPITSTSTFAPEIKETTTTEPSTSPETLMGIERADERQVETAVVRSFVREMENVLIPEHGEIIVINVGPADQKKQLFAVSRKRTSVVNSDSDFVEIFSDIITGTVFQYIQCKNPSHLTALHFRDETLLAFMESRREVQILVYRGIQGFVFFKSIRLNANAHRMSAVTVPPKLPYQCHSHYLVIQFSNELQFMKVKIDGNCGLSHVECDGN